MSAKQEIQARVSKYFERDSKKITAWWNTPNPLLGDMTPIYFAQVKGFEKLLKHVKDWQEGNRA